MHSYLFTMSVKPNKPLSLSGGVGKLTIKVFVDGKSAVFKVFGFQSVDEVVRLACRRQVKHIEIISCKGRGLRRTRLNFGDRAVRIGAFLGNRDCVFIQTYN